jgi:hypothetical protein
MNMVSNWTETAKSRWGTNFRGFYYIDEVAGRQLDLLSKWIVVKNATDYADATSKFTRSVGSSVNWYRNGYSDWANLSLFTSDYALYHFDYKVGYDVVFAQLGWNYSRQLNIALCRGAATTQKDWVHQLRNTAHHTFNQQASSSMTGFSLPTAQNTWLFSTQTRIHTNHPDQRSSGRHEQF